MSFHGALDVTSRRARTSSWPCTATRSRSAPRPAPRLLADAGSPLAALRQWIDLFVDLLVTKHGLADTVQPGSSGYASLRTYFIDRLMPVAGQLLDAAVAAGEIRPAIEPYELMRGIGNLCLAPDPRCDPRKLIALLLAGLQHPEPSA